MLKFICEVEKNSYTHLEKSIIHSLKAKINTVRGAEKQMQIHETSKAEEKQIWILAILLYYFSQIK